MAGHSPGIGLEYDLDTARQLLVEVGFPKGKGFPTLVVTWPNIGPWSSTARAEVARQWREGLGIEIKIQGRSPEITEDVQFGGWTADYPDPDTFLRVMLHATLLNKVGWHDDLYFQLVDEAAHTPDRARRLALYRQADRYLVAEQALVYPRGYGNRAIVAKPWLKDCKINPLGWIDFKNIIVEPH
jgi:oligopeptide transport system substrate-binding protein